MKQMVKTDFSALTVVPVGDIPAGEPVFACDAIGRVFVVEASADEPLLFPVLTNGRISRTGQPSERSVLLSVIDPITLGITNLQWTKSPSVGSRSDFAALNT